ncbi:GlxA family transcriptional regulator [Kitasatospora sp. NPDC088346]|uniref:GlxA family transcriptional regulator n=1 Tax=Kitasatospora sp. NPDC088346 TaxID=3364073 RepID=UPI0038203C09
MGTREVLVVLFDGVVALNVVGPLEVFTEANAWAARRFPASPGGPAYLVRTAGPAGRPVRTSGGLTLLPDLDLYAAEPPHTLVVPGGATTPHGGTVLDPDVVAWLASGAVRRCRRVVAVGTGAFSLAEARLLRGRRATTHWRRTAELAARHPDVRVETEPTVVRDGRVSTSAGAAGGIDLALALVEDDLGREAAVLIARHLLVSAQRHGSQQQFTVRPRGRPARRPGLRTVQRWIAEHPDADLSVPALARRAGLSPRHFSRAFTAETGTPPGRYVDRIRLETARRLLDDTPAPVEHVARQAGYPTPEAMRRAFRRTIGLSPLQYRLKS